MGGSNFIKHFSVSMCCCCLLPEFIIFLPKFFIFLPKYPDSEILPTGDWNSCPRIIHSANSFLKVPCWVAKKKTIVSYKKAIFFSSSYSVKSSWVLFLHLLNSSCFATLTALSSTSTFPWKVCTHFHGHYNSDHAGSLLWVFSAQPLSGVLGPGYLTIGKFQARSLLCLGL